MDTYRKILIRNGIIFEKNISSQSTKKQKEKKKKIWNNYIGYKHNPDTDPKE